MDVCHTNSTGTRIIRIDSMVLVPTLFYTVTLAVERSWQAKIQEGIGFRFDTELFDGHYCRIISLHFFVVVVADTKVSIRPGRSHLRN